MGRVNPEVTPVSVDELPDGRIRVLVHQLVKDFNDVTLFEGTVQHIYIIENGLITTMEIVKEDL